MNYRSLAIPAALLLGLSLAAAAPQKKAAPPAKPPAAAKKVPAKPDINSAWQVELEKLPGITRPLAKKIIANRPYRALDDLKRVGIPAETIEKLRPLVVVDESMGGAAHPVLPKMPAPKPKTGKS
jgi:DNA uptake protein ComE-like DNA-binding protein